ncbi:response regulator [Niveispirillum sp. BGYR6]|uniref:response regulator n=1 Tax=Niveispirillum sp. BGYR6 TaxID=2971249 RepID=UPI0022B98CD1|nr:response regulator [Niveispirillum sp. BGYR6]MDG5495442.1 response regulator [Niveispirillum sp. BGYR6]
MPDVDFRPVQVMIVDKDSNTRRLLRGILSRVGIDKITDFPNTTDVPAALLASPPDLLFIDADAAEPEGLRFVQNLRHAQQPHNPFLCIIAMTWQPTQPLMMRFTASGADDLMVKPFSAKQVQDRLTNLIDGRKGFVVTADYIGPDRRRQPREGIQIPLFNVPNSLRLKVTGLFDKARINDAVADALEAINVQKVVRGGFQLAFLADFAAPGASAGGDKMAADHLLRIGPVLDDLMRRLRPDSDLRPTLETYATTIRATLEAFKAAPDKPAGGMPALLAAAIGIAAATSRRSNIGVVEQEVRGAVTSYRNRLAEIAQAKAAPAAAAAPAGAPAEKEVEARG